MHRHSLELVGGSYIQADETPIDLQLHDGRGQNHQAYLWQYGKPGGGVVFDFRLGRGREGPKEFLGQFAAILQTDGCAAYYEVGGPKMVHACCWTNSRRKFFEAAELNPGDAAATRIVARIDEMFAIDARAREQNLDQAARHALRLEHAKPLLEIIRQEIEAARSASLPSSALGKAAKYTLVRWRELTCFLEYPELELSNNLAENSMRPVALGRKNWIHVGSRQAGPKVAAILSIVESCRRMCAIDSVSAFWNPRWACLQTGSRYTGEIRGRNGNSGLKAMNSNHGDASTVISRRAALSLGPVGLSALAVSDPLAAASPQTAQFPPEAPRPKEGLRIATCQFAVSGNVAENARHIREFMLRAVKSGAHLLHTSEACLSGYPGPDLPSFTGFDWELLRLETAALRELAKKLDLWLVLGSAHFLDAQTKPTNCLYLLGPDGRIVDRYDKSMCTKGDQKHYSAGSHLAVRDIRGVRVGLAICYDICWPQIYIAYRERGVTLMLHSFYNARSKGENCLDVLNVRQVPTRCADNRIWAVANNSSQPYSHWASFVARPDATIAKQLAINEPGMLIHDFPDGLSERGWYHNERPMRLRDDELMTWGQPSRHPRQLDPRAEP